jgi:hypothetical protein
MSSMSRMSSILSGQQRVGLGISRRTSCSFRAPWLAWKGVAIQRRDIVCGYCLVVLTAQNARFSSMTPQRRFI